MHITAFYFKHLRVKCLVSGDLISVSVTVLILISIPNNRTSPWPSGLTYRRFQSSRTSWGPWFMSRQGHQYVGGFGLGISYGAIQVKSRVLWSVVRINNQCLLSKHLRKKKGFCIEHSPTWNLPCNFTVVWMLSYVGKDFSCKMS